MLTAYMDTRGLALVVMIIVVIAIAYSIRESIGKAVLLVFQFIWTLPVVLIGLTFFIIIDIIQIPFAIVGMNVEFQSGKFINEVFSK